MAARLALAGTIALPICLIAVAVVTGGGGSPAPVAEALVELAALVIAAVAIARGLRPVGFEPVDRTSALLVGAIVAFPLVQLVPLPLALWQALPGRGGVVAAMEAGGEARAWLPWSLLRDGGIAASLALVPALVLALLTAPLPLRRRVDLIAALAGVGMVAAVVGLVQFVGGPDRALAFYRGGHEGWATGFFANRNAQADLIAITLLAVILLAERFRDRIASGTVRIGLVGALLLLLIGGVATGSRMGMAVLAIPVALAVAMAGRRAPGAAIALVAGAALLLLGGTALDRVTARVHDAGNRTEIWGDSLLVARQVAPVGAGMGSFQPLYAAAERLDHVQPTIANRAHNDYLELAIEGGVPALALLAAALVLVARRARAGWRDADPDRRLLARFAALTTLILAVHSTVDYPLRNLALLSVAGLALGGLASAPRLRARVGAKQGLGGRVHAH